MSKKLAATVAKFGPLGGDKLYQKRTRLTLLFVVRLAKAIQTIHYSDLADELNFLNPRCFNYILGAIGNALSKSYDTDTPPIQCLVVSKSSQILFKRER